MAGRLDRQEATGRAFYMPGRGNLFGFPTHPGQDSTATTGVPTDGVQGFAPSAIFFNWLGGVGTTLYVNVGTFASAKWLNIDAEANQVTVTATTLTVTALAHANRTIILSNTAGCAATLPAATGSGLIYRFAVGIVPTTGNYVISTSPSTDIYKGQIVTCSTTETPDLAQPWITSTNSNTITLNGTTLGGFTIGDLITIQDLLAGVWMLLGFTTSSSTEATPLSHV